MTDHVEQIFSFAKELYSVSPIKAHDIRVTGNRIFEVNRDDTQYILRASEHTTFRESAIFLELDWMRYLSRHLEGIVRPEESKNGNLCEIISTDDEKKYIICMMEKARGKVADVSDKDEFNEELFFNLGSLMGDMHRLTANYEGNVRKAEFEWNGPASAWRNDNTIADEAVRACQEKYYNEICALPITKENYGLIHFDIHTDNFFVNDGKIKLFDFNSFQFNWYTADIASAIFFMLLKGAGPHMPENERKEFAEAYILSYLKGYLQTNSINEYWLGKLDLFIKYQMTDEYLAAQLFWPEGDEEKRLWYLNWHKERLVNDISYVDVDLDKLAKSLPIKK